MAETVTIVGNVGSDPHHMITPSGLSITKFRVGCTHRAYDNATNSWVDKHTNWYQVSTFRQVADHAQASIKRGDSVIVTGRIIQRQWEANGRTGTSVDLEADTVGHDLRWGTSTWTRKPKSGAVATQNSAEPAPPVGDAHDSSDGGWPEPLGAPAEMSTQ